MRTGSTKLGQDMAIVRLISLKFPDFPCSLSLSPAYDCLALGPELHMGGNVGSWIGGGEEAGLAPSHVRANSGSRTYQHSHPGQLTHPLYQSYLFIKKGRK